MNKKSMISICFISVVIIFFVLICNHMTYSPLILQQTVQNYLGFKEYKNCHLIKIANFEEIEEKVVDIEVTDDEINSYIENILSENYSRTKIIHRNKVMIDDLAISDYKIMDGKNEIGNIKDAPIRVGTGNYDVFLENAILDLEIGKEHMINWAVPSDYENQEWAGKELKIHIMIKELYKVEIPTIEEYVLENGYKNINEFKENVKNNLLKSKKESLLEHYSELIIDEMIEKSKFKIDDDIVVENAINFYYYYENLADVCGVTIEEYLEDSTNMYDDIYDICYEDSLREIQRILVIGRYAEKYKMMVLEEEIDTYCKDKKIIREELNEGDIISITYCIIEEKVLKHIIENYIAI